MKSIEEGAFASKRVLVRIDADVPISDGEHPRVVNDYRLQKLLPTLFYLMNHRAKIILVGHMGRPKGKTVKDLSLKPVFTHLSGLVGKRVLFAPSLFSKETEAAIENLKDCEIIGLENLRFDKGEENNSRTFAKKLSRYADIYVNESFATSHRDAASIVAITEFLPKFCGLQLEREVEILSSLTQHPARPFVAIIGGAKVDDKLPVIQKLLSHVDRVLVGGGVANTFLAANGFDVKDSSIDPEYLDDSRKILARAKGKIILPTDVKWDDGKILDIGPESINNFLKYVKAAKTILWAGPIGKFEDKRFIESGRVLAEQIASSPATSVAGGGNTLDMLSTLGVLDQFSFVSTGGGATLDFLANGSLPGIKALH